MNKMYMRSARSYQTNYNSIEQRQLDTTGVAHVNGNKLEEWQSDIRGPFQVLEFKNDNCAIVRVNIQRATLAEAIDFKKYLEVILNEGINNLIIDINSCTFIDSTFFGVIVGALKKTKANNGNLYLVYNPEKQLPLFKDTGLAKIFTIYKDLEEAYTILKLK